jgi:hypothetical protein
MLTIKFTVRIKPEHKPRVLKKGMAAGVLLEQEVVYKTKTKEDLNNDPLFAKYVLEYQEQLLNEYLEVHPEIVENETNTTPTKCTASSSRRKGVARR